MSVEVAPNLGTSGPTSTGFGPISAKVDPDSSRCTDQGLPDLGKIGLHSMHGSRCGALIEQHSVLASKNAEAHQASTPSLSNIDQFGGNLGQVRATSTNSGATSAGSGEIAQFKGTGIGRWGEGKVDELKLGRFRQTSGEIDQS